MGNDPTPWQRLNRQQQAAFNEKYLALRPDLQEYSKAQFTALSEERQEHAFNMFLGLDVKTLTEGIEGELVREREAAEQQRLAQETERQRQDEIRRAHQQQQQQQQQQRNRFQEQPRSQGRTNFNQFQQPQQQQQFQQQAPQFQANRQRPNFDPRRQPAQPQQQQFQPQQQQRQQFQGFSQFQQQPQQPQQPQPAQQRQISAADQRHLAQAEAQIAEAVRLQGCLANPAACAQFPTYYLSNN